MENPQTTWKRCWTSSVDPLQHGTARADQCSLSLRYATAGVLSLYLLRCCEANNKGFHTGEKAVKEYWGARGLLAAVGAGVWRKTPRPPTSGARHRHWRSGNSGVILFIPSSILLQSIFSNSSCCPKIWNLYNFPTSRSSRCGHQAHWGETCRLPHHLPTAARMAPSRSHIKSAKTLIQIWLLFCTCGWTGILICPCKALSTSRLNFKLKLEIKQQREGKVSQWNMCLTKVTSVWEVWKRN